MSFKKDIENKIQELEVKVANGTATKTETKRLNNAKHYLRNTADSGRYGKAFEVLSVDSKSRKTTVASQGKNDDYFYLDGKRIPLEKKINGGRVDTILNGVNKAKYVKYTLDICNSNTKGKQRTIEPVIIPVELFKQKLIEFGALKNARHKGKVDGIAIQSSNKAWYEWLSDYPITRVKDYNYELWEFEGLE